MDHTTRKLQKVGGGTYTISVPKTWATAHDLSAGAPVDVYPDRNGSLILRRADAENDPLAETTIEVADPTTSPLHDRLRAAYTAGYETITFTTPDEFTADQRRDVRRAATRYNGLEVVTESATEVVVTDVLDSNAVSLEQSLTRLQFIALSRLRTAVTALADPTAPDAGLRRDEDAGRITAHVVRRFNRTIASPEAIRHLDVDRPTLAVQCEVAQCLRRIARHGDTLHDVTGVAVPDSVSDDFLAAGSATVAVVDEAATAILGAPDRTVERATAALSRRDDVEAHFEDLESTLTAADESAGYALGIARAELDAIATAGADVARLALRHPTDGTLE